MPEAGQYEPTGQDAPDVKPLTEQNFPAGHGMLALRPFWGQTKPTGHVVSSMLLMDGQ
jgi:hypothetical protein